MEKLLKKKKEAQYDIGKKVCLKITNIKLYDVASVIRGMLEKGGCYL